MYLSWATLRADRREGEELPGGRRPVRRIVAAAAGVGRGPEGFAARLGHRAG
ncbi:hypothetical protein ACIBAG_28920 [Streptomyces sp. NPDC051243]|uniref:hypothetical protein n=1 Tax=Streptomyces sp. NPDC051243 TaxID=3365646 RepID=UPI00379EDBDF